MNLLDMKGRYAVITAATTGLGLAIAQRMLASGGAHELCRPGGCQDGDF